MEVLPFLVFAGFVLLFYVQARRSGMTMNEWFEARNAARPYVPGWWKPAAVLVAGLLVLVIAVATAKHGFKWAYLLTIPILGGFFVAAAALLSWLFQRQQRR
jgi:peptidoglycan/LPS O-acetylase OafA/YrhL